MLPRISPRTLPAALVIPSATVATGLPAIVAALVGNRAWPERLTHLWADAVLGVSGVDLRATGQDRLDPERTYIFVSNHQSHLDVPAIVASYGGPIRFVAKKGLFQVPLFGQVLRALGHVSVDRGNSEQARRSLADAVDRVRNDVSLLFFAEGTRSVDGRLGPFKRGALAMAELTGVPVVPVGVAGSGGVLPKGSLAFRGGPVAVAFGAPLTAAGDRERPRDERLAHLRSAVMESMAEAQALLG